MTIPEFDGCLWLTGTVNDKNIIGVTTDSQIEFLKELQNLMLKHRVNKLDVAWDAISFMEGEVKQKMQY